MKKKKNVCFWVLATVLFVSRLVGDDAVVVSVDGWVAKLFGTRKMEKEGE